MNLFNFATSFGALKSTKTAMSDANIPPQTDSSSLSFFEGDAIVVERIQPKRTGCVRFRGVYWFARCDEEITLLPGAIVSVIGRRKLTLIVR